MAAAAESKKREKEEKERQERKAAAERADRIAMELIREEEENLERSLQEEKKRRRKEKKKSEKEALKAKNEFEAKMKEKEAIEKEEEEEKEEGGGQAGSSASRTIEMTEENSLQDSDEDGKWMSASRKHRKKAQGLSSGTGEKMAPTKHNTFHPPPAPPRAPSQPRAPIFTHMRADKAGVYASDLEKGFELETLAKQNFDFLTHDILQVEASSSQESIDQAILESNGYNCESTSRFILTDLS